MSIKNAEALDLLRDLGQPKQIEKGTTLAMEGETYIDCSSKFR